MTILMLIAPAIAIAAAVFQKSLILALVALTLLSVAVTIRLKGSLQSFAMLATSLLVSWTALETALAFLEQPPAADVAFFQPGTEQPVAYWRSSDAFGILPEGGVHRARKAAVNGEVIYDVVYSIRNDGFRKPPQQDPSEGENVYFLGGSATFGEGLNDDQTLPWHFGRLETERQVHNKAMSGWGVHQAYTVWQSQIVDPGATVIIQTAPWHADRAACIPKYSGLSPRYEMVGEKLEQVGRCRTWFDHRALSLAMIKSNILQRSYDLWNGERAKRKMELYFAILQAMGKLADERGQCFIIGFNKAKEDYLADTGYSNDAIVDRLTELGLHVIDITLAERKEDLDPIYFIAGDGHPTAEANEAKAALLSVASERCEQKLLTKNDNR